MKKYILLLFSFLLFGGQNVYAWTVELTEDELQAKINKILPVEKKRLLFTVRVSSLDVALTEGSDRIELIADIDIKSSHLSSGQGRAHIDGTLAYQPAEGAFYFHDSQVKNVSFENIPDKYHMVVQKIFQRAIARRLSKSPVYKLDKNKTKHQIAKTLLKSVKVVDQKLLLELGLL